MKKKDFQTWRDRTDEELRTELHRLREALFNLRYQMTLNQLSNISAIRNTRKDIARMEFLLGERSRNVG